MKTSRLKVVLIMLIVFVLVVLGVAVGARKWPPRKQEKGQLKATDALPEVKSQVKGIEVLSTFVDAEGLLNITVSNKTGKTVVGIGLSSGTMTYTDDNGLSEDNPKALII